MHKVSYKGVCCAIVLPSAHSIQGVPWAFAYAVLVTELLLVDDEDDDDEDGGKWRGRGGRCTEANVIDTRGGLHQHTVVVLVAGALNCKPHFYVSSSSRLLPRTLTLASPLSHHSNGAGPACSAAGYRKAEDEMSGTTSQADPIDATARIVLLNRAQTTKFCDNHVRWVHSYLFGMEQEKVTL